jgi:thiamine phosphate synthase YjbQ (UPF0047 family)
VPIIPQLKNIVRRSGIQEGLALVSAMHITAGVHVNGNEQGVDRGH